MVVLALTTNVAFSSLTLSFIRTHEDRCAFVALILPYISRDVFETVGRYQDLAKLSLPPVLPADWAHGCVYAKLAVLPATRPRMCRVPGERKPQPRSYPMRLRADLRLTPAADRTKGN